MKKYLKYLIGIIGIFFFFIWIDGSGVGLKQRFSQVDRWANK